MSTAIAINNDNGNYDFLFRSVDPSLYQISEDEATFLKKCTGIKDDEELKQHILQVQAEAFAVFPYPCIRRFAFIDSSLPKNADYPAVLNLAKNRENAILLDIGCALGNDARRAISDGFPLQNVVCSDLRKGFFDISHKLYKTTEETFNLAFYEGDVFETSFTNQDEDSTGVAIPDLHILKNLGQLKHKISVINASAFFHLFDNDKQRQLAIILATLLSPQPGSIILGNQGGSTEFLVRPSPMAPETLLALHSPESWRELWVGPGGPFKPDEVKIHTEIRTLSLARIGITVVDESYSKANRLSWSIKRI